MLIDINTLFGENGYLVLTFYFLLSIIYLFLIVFYVITTYVGANIGPFGSHPLVIRLAFIPGIVGSELALHYVMFMSTLSLFLWKINFFNYFYYFNSFSLYILAITSVYLLRNYIEGFKFSTISKQVIDQFYIKTTPRSSKQQQKKKSLSSPENKKILVRGKSIIGDLNSENIKSSSPSLNSNKNIIIRTFNNIREFKKNLQRNIENYVANVYNNSNENSSTTTKESSHLEEPSKLSILYWFKLLIPIPSIHFPGVHRIVDIPYANDDEFQRLDVFFHESCSSSGRPILVYVHGGGWKVGGGKRSTCGLPLIYQMASKNWIVFSIGYRLAPDNKFPTHLYDIKKAIQWIRDNATHYGGDIDSMFISGGSAGGHLASLACLTDGITFDDLFNNNNKGKKEEEKEESEENEETQEKEMKKVYPPFRGCVSYYAVYDFTNRFKSWAFDFPFYLGDVIMRNTIENEPELYKNGSPIDQIKESTRIPFLVVHGDYDELVPMKESLQFIEKYQDTVPNAKVTWLPVPGAHHAFDLLFSPRTIYSVYSTYRYLNRLYKLHQHEKLKLKQIQQQHLILLNQTKKNHSNLDRLDDMNLIISTPSV